MPKYAMQSLMTAAERALENAVSFLILWNPYAVFSNRKRYLNY